MSFSPSSTDRLLSIYLALAQYPILSERIRTRMRNMLFERGIITPQAFELQVRELAVRSQEREGLRNPFEDEPAETWDLRISRIRNQYTDLIFSRHLKYEDFERIVEVVLSERGVSSQDIMVAFNPELAPTEQVFQQAMTIEHLPGEQRAKNEARLREMKVVLIRTLISDQLPYINIAKEWFTISDLAEIRRRKIGLGRIGGKAAGMLLALRVLKEMAGQDLQQCLASAPSYFVGADLMYSFMSLNNLTHWNDQKYKTEEEMRAEYPQIIRDFEQGDMIPEMLDKLTGVLVDVGKQPLIVRSSSLLEDNFGTAFAGKYESVFLPNQRSLQQNLRALVRGMARIYASTLNPNALLYRRSRGLQDYDERMAILIQVVQGEQFGRYYLPHAAGVAFSRNLYRWTPHIRREDGFVRLVWGLGTRAVDRVGNDFPRLIALSHPLLRPSTDAKAIRRYSQQFVDLIDLEDNDLKTLPIQQVLKSRYPPLRYLAQVDEDGYFSPLRTNLVQGDASQLVLTFDELLRRTVFAERMREILHLLEQNYRAPVDLEFTLHLVTDGDEPKLRIAILQCRPQSHLLPAETVQVPVDLPKEDIVFSTHFVVPQGYVDRIDYVVFVEPQKYFALNTLDLRQALARAVGRVNAALKDERFICIGPGRWGSSNTDLGVPIDYGDIYNASALVELSGKGIGPDPEPSLGTHFFQDLLEAQIYPLAVALDDPANIFRRDFFYKTPNRIAQWIEIEEPLCSCLRVIRVADYRADAYLRLVMNDEQGVAVAYLAKD
ncbi:MAG: PEP/pyruvate-binding domain-containing protein [Anaerolineaceae bacterium]|jgi:hypothetical protein